MLISAAAAATDVVTADSSARCADVVMNMPHQSVAKVAQAVATVANVGDAHNVDTNSCTSAIAVQSVAADFSAMATADVVATDKSTLRNADRCTAQLRILTTQLAAHATS